MSDGVASSVELARRPSGQSLAADGQRSSEPPTVEPSLSDFEVHGLVGEGEFGRVLMATCVTTKKLYAMKVVRKADLLLRGHTSVSQAITEKQVLQEIAIKPHPYIVSLHYAFQTEESLYLLMDYVGGGDLFTLIESKGALPEPAVCVYSAELVLALEHVHSLHIIFRDLKPENIMVGMDGHLKLTDFGMSKRLAQHGSDDAPAQRAVAGTICGTPEYIAPEVLQGKPYDAAIDWWTLGCITYEMLVGRPPFRSADMGMLVQQIIKARVELPSSLSADATSIIRAFLQTDASLRLGASPHGASAVKSAAFFSGVDWAKLFAREVKAPLTPTDGTLPHVAERQRGRHGEGAELLQREFTAWSGAGRPVHAASGAHEASESLSEQQYSFATSLALELTAEGAIWAISPPLLRLLGISRSVQHTLLGKSMIQERSSLVVEQDVHRLSVSFAEALESSTPDLSSDRADHSIMLMLMEDVTDEEVSKALVRRRYEFSYNSKLPDADVAALFAPSMKLSGTILPTSAAHLSGVDAYLDRRQHLVSAFPDIHYRLLEQTCKADRSGGVQRVFTSWQWVGTHAGPYYAKNFDGSFTKVLPTGNKVRCHGVAVDTCIDGPDRVRLIAEHAGYFDEAALRMQLGEPEVASDAEAIRKRAAEVLGKAKPRLASSGSSGAAVGTPNSREAVSRSDSRNAVSDTTSPASSAGEQPPSAGRAQASRRSQLVSSPAPHANPSSLKRNTSSSELPALEGGTDESFSKRYVSEESFTKRTGGDDSFTKRLGRPSASPAAVPSTTPYVQLYLTAVQPHALTEHDWVEHDSFDMMLPASARVASQPPGASYVLRAALRVSLASSLQMSEIERETFVHMEEFYAGKAMRQLAAFEGDGFFIAIHASPQPLNPTPPANSRPTHSGPRVILASHAFADILKVAGHEVLRTPLLDLIANLGEISEPEIVAQLADAIAHRRACKLLFSVRWQRSASTDPPASSSPSQRPSAIPPSASSASSVGASPPAAKRSVPPDAAKRSDAAAEEIAADLGPPAAQYPWSASERLSSASEAEHGAEASRGRAGDAAAGGASVLLLLISPIEVDHKPYWSGLVADLTHSLLPSQDPEQVRHYTTPLSGTPASSALAAQLAGPASAQPPLHRCFLEALPRSWTWFGGKQLYIALTAAMHALEAGISLSDLAAEDAPLVWLSQGFTAINGYSRREAIGNNCRFLQSEATDPSAVMALRKAVHKGERTRVHLYNEDSKRCGYWSIISLHPAVGEELIERDPSTPPAMAEAALAQWSRSRRTSGEITNVRTRYMMGVQIRLSHVEMKAAVELGQLALEANAPPPPIDSEWMHAPTRVPASPDGGLMIAEALEALDLAPALQRWCARYEAAHGRAPTREEVMLSVHLAIGSTLTSRIMD